MNTLLIAPDVNLPALDDEINAVSVALRPAVLHGSVTRRTVLDALRGRTWDIIWFATHGDQTGIQLSDGPLGVADLTAVVRTSGAWLAVLNTCASRLIGLELHYELGCAVITTQADIADLTAYQTAALLAQSLAENSDVRTAYNASKPGQAQNYWLFDSAVATQAEETRTILLLNEWGARLGSKIDNLERRLDREIGALRQQMNNLSTNMQHAVRLPSWHRGAFTAAFSLLFLPVPLFYSQIRDLLQIGWHTSLLLAFSAYLFSALFWSYLWWGGKR
jgi:hypothetical protein